MIELLRMYCWSIYSHLMQAGSKALLQPVTDKGGTGYVIAIRPCDCGRAEGECSHHRKYKAFTAYIAEHWSTELALVEHATNIEARQSKAGTN